MKYIVNFQKEIKTDGKNEGEAIISAMNKLKQELIDKRVNISHIFDIDIEQY